MSNLVDWLRDVLRLPEHAARGVLEQELNEARAQTYRLIEEVGQLRKRPPEPDPFAILFVEGIALIGGAEVRPMTCGIGGRVRKTGTLLELTAQRPMRNARALVFCDFERVEVGGFFLGTEYIHAAPPGECPAAFVPDWPVGVKLRAQCVQRRTDDR